jgi:hypothetical protein
MKINLQQIDEYSAREQQSRYYRGKDTSAMLCGSCEEEIDFEYQDDEICHICNEHRVLYLIEETYEKR